MTWARRWTGATSAVRPRLLVVGGASLDVIHVGGHPVRTPGGAGLYTALAATRAGAEVTMLAPYPEPMPPELAPVLDRIRWVGPRVAIAELPRFEIAYDDAGAVTLFREHLGAEPDMTPALLDALDDLPGCAYCVPFLDARLQQSFIAALAARGCLTVGSTYGKAVHDETATVRRTVDLADLFFCNAAEATGLFGSPDLAHAPAGRFRFVTRGAAGATVFQGDHRTDVAPVPTVALDPTGAGDTFCGTTVARLLAGDHPVEAARRGTVAAAEMVTMVGPAALWAAGPGPLPPADPRVRVDVAAVERLGGRIRALPDLAGFTFVGELFPAVGDPGALDWFVAATLQQYGFWYERGGCYGGPMIATIDGFERRGSDYLWAQYLRWQRTAPNALLPRSQSELTVHEWATAAADDSGADPFPDSHQRVASAHAYGSSLTEIGLTPGELVAVAAADPTPMRSLLRLLDHVGGYREDPLRKKAALLGLILRQRPEGFLPDPATDTGDDSTDDVPPIVDYHVQRTALRTGLVVVDDAALHARLVARELLSAEDEQAVRRVTYDAVLALAGSSERPMGVVDWFLFQMRHRCPEIAPPRCDECPAEPACAQRVELFQPVLRTTAY